MAFASAPDGTLTKTHVYGNEKHFTLEQWPGKDDPFVNRHVIKSGDLNADKSLGNWQHNRDFY